MSSYFERLEGHLLDAVERQARRQHRPGLPGVFALRRAAHGARVVRGHRWRPLVLIFALVLAGAAGALAAGVFQLGSPFGSNPRQTSSVAAGLATRPSVHVLAISVPDPQGGPPWGLRIERTTRGLVCIQAGRLDYGTIGVLGIDHAFNNDGRFHPLAINADPTPNCATTDAHGNAFLNVTSQGVPASGLALSCHGVAASLFATLTRGGGAANYRRAAEHEPGPVCAPSQLRDLYFGLLGPDAISITYPGRNGQLTTERTVGNDGAYLVLGPPSEATCTPDGGCGYVPQTPGLAPGFVNRVTYRNGSVCDLAALGEKEANAAAQRRAHRLSAIAAKFPALAPLLHRGPPFHLTAREKAIVTSRVYRNYIRNYDRSESQAPPPQTCPLVGYAAAHTRHITSAQVATPISAHVGKGTRWCGEVHGHRRCDQPQIKLVIGFTARVPVTKYASSYAIDMTFTPTGRCPQLATAGFGWTTDRNLRAGQRITMSTSALACPGIEHIRVVYSQGKAPSGYLIESPGLPQGVLVGKVNIPIK